MLTKSSSSRFKIRLSACDLAKGVRLYLVFLAIHKPALWAMVSAIVKTYIVSRRKVQNMQKISLFILITAGLFPFLFSSCSTVGETASEKGRSTEKEYISNADETFQSAWWNRQNGS